MLVFNAWILVCACIANEDKFGRIPFEPLNENLNFGNVVDLCRDHRGYLWIGNYDMGVTRYDGYETIEYKTNPDEPASLSNSFVTCLLEDCGLNLWVGTRNGLNRYIRELDSFKRYFVDESEDELALENQVNCIYQDPLSRLWVVRNQSIHLYYPDRDEFETIVKGDATQVLGRMTGMMMDVDGNYWLVSTHPGIYKFDPESGNFVYYQNDSPAGDVVGFRILMEDSLGNIWVGTRGGCLQSFDRTTKSFTSYLTDCGGIGTNGKQIWDIVEYPQGQLLIAINQGGINRLDLQTGKFSNQSNKDTIPGKLSGDGVVSLLYDNEAILWAGSSRSGIDCYNPKNQRFQKITKGEGDKSVGLVGDVVGCVFEDSEGLIWVGTDGNGVSVLDPYRNDILSIPYPERSDLLVSGVIRSISQDSKGRFWINSWRNGMVILEKTGDTFRRYTGLDDRLANLPGLLCWSHLVDGKDRVWVTTQKGDVYLFDSEMNSIGHFFPSEKYSDDDIPILYEENGVVFLSHSYGLYTFDESKNELKLVVETPRSNITRFDGEKYYYCATPTLGLTIYDHNGTLVETVGVAEGLSDPFVSSIEFDEDGNVWLGTNNGLNMFDPETGEIRSFNHFDGLPSDQFFTQASMRQSSGDLWFGSLKGLVHFAPSKIVENPYIPEVFIYDISINNQLIDFRNEDAPFSIHPQTLESFELEWYQNSIKFRFGSVSLTASAKNKYAYQLIGWNEDWIPADLLNRSVSYTNLSPGKYTFRVKASNNDGVWNEEGCSISFHIHPPFWRTGWFYGVASIALFWFIYQFFAFREKQHKANKLKLETAVFERTQTIEEQKNELQIKGQELLEHRDRLEETVLERTKDLVDARDRAEKSDRLKSRFLANMSHEIRTPLNAIVGLSSFLNDRSLKDEEREEFTRAIRSNSNSLLSLIEDILDFSMIESGHLKISDDEVNINQLLEVLKASHSANLRNQSLYLTLDDSYLDQNWVIHSDSVRLKQILDNLINNALKFTEKGEVKFGMKTSQGVLKLYVTDSGPGIPDDQVDTIFREFEKLEKHHSEAIRGVGLGLAISKRLSVMLGADLHVDSVVGKGSTFTLSFPMQCVSRSRGMSIQEPFEVPKTSAVNIKGKRYLVIEDESSNYIYLSEILKKRGADVEHALNGEEGIRRVEASVFDLIFLDIKMPGIDGYETLKRIRALDNTIPVVAQTAFALLADRKRIEEAGFDDALWKPIPVDEIFRVVSKFN